MLETKDQEHGAKIFFLFYESKTNTVIELRKGHFRGLVAFEAKDLSIEAKDFKRVLEDFLEAKNVLEDSTSGLSHWLPHAEFQHFRQNST